jgi:carbamate kinase
VLVVVALGRNALARRGESLDVERQRANVRVAATALAELAGRHDLVITHGSGTQVGLLALQAEAVGNAAPLDVLGAGSEGMIGYWIEQELSNQLPDRDVATLLTQVEVAADDPAFESPSEPIGPVYPEAEARRIAEARGWRIAPDHGGYRRVVPSPAPRGIHELRTIQLLVKLGVIVVCGGGGGIPVVKTADGGFHGVEAVIDKDLSAALLATHLGADFLLMLSDVPAVYADWPEPGREQIRAIPPRKLREFSFEPETMAPKIEAARRFATQPGRVAAIGALEEAARILRGKAGTTISASAQKVQIVSDGGDGPAGRLRGGKRRKAKP